MWLKKSIHTVCLILIIILLTDILLAGSTGKIEGQVTLKDCGFLIVGASVEVSGMGSIVKTDFYGNFKMDLIPSGVHYLRLFAEDLISIDSIEIDIIKDSTITLNIEMESDSGCGISIRGGRVGEVRYIIGRENGPTDPLNGAGPMNLGVMSPSDSGVIFGRVTDAITGEPISGARVNLVKPMSSTMSDSFGYYSIKNLNSGKYVVSVGFPKYITSYKKSIKVKKNKITVADFRLQPKDE